MPCLQINLGNTCGFLCVSKGPYTFEGYHFEIHSYFGPIKLNKNGSVSAKQPTAFFNAVRKWQELSEEERERYQKETDQ